MAKFKSKVVEIEAVQWNGAGFSPPLPEWFGKAWTDRTIDRDEDDRSILYIKTLEGTMTANPGDWIICGTEGELYPCKPSVFERKYEPSTNSE